MTESCCDPEGPKVKRQKTEITADGGTYLYDPKFWGPYLSDRQWGTVREDRSTDFNCWQDFPHDAATRGVYRWGEDGLMGLSDHENKLCAGLAVWNGKDHILKERLFGLTNPEGNHGEDVKELYYYLDNTVDHTYMKSLYRYPHKEFPYTELRDSGRDRTEAELEILDTGVFGNNAFWDIYTEYSKDIPGSVLCRYTVLNRSDNECSLVLLPQFWFRNTWSSKDVDTVKPNFQHEQLKIQALYELGQFDIHFGIDEDNCLPEILLTENEDIFTISGKEDTQYMKDGFHQYVIHGNKNAVKCSGNGTKCCAVYNLTVPPGGMKKIYWTIYPSDKSSPMYLPQTLGQYCDLVFRKRQQEADSYYNTIFPSSWSREERSVARQACAGLLWSKQFYCYNVQSQWQQVGQPSHREIEPSNKSQSSVEGSQRSSSTSDAISVATDPLSPEENKRMMPSTAKEVPQQNEDETREEVQKDGSRTKTDKVKEAIAVKAGVTETEASTEEKDPRTWNRDWEHFDAHDILSVPDKWEFPWFAAWDTGFQMIPFCRLDPEFAKQQLLLLLSDRYIHPSGQIPGCEFNLIDLNPPVHAYACLKVFRMTGSSDLLFIQQCYKQLKRNYNWMRHNTAVRDRCIYTGGFLGMDNIGIVDRSHPPEGTTLEQADATGWMAMYALNMLELSLELGTDDTMIAGDAALYLSHFLDTAEALNLNIHDGGLWNDEDKFYNDVLVTGNSREAICVQSLVGLVPVLACVILNTRRCSPTLLQCLRDSCKAKPSYVQKIADGSYILSAVPWCRLQSILGRMFGSEEFMSPHGIRSLSKVHEGNPFEMEIEQEIFTVKYTPGESNMAMFGGNSNWRGPVWLCMNYIIVEALELHQQATPGGVLVETKDKNKPFTLAEGIREICRRIVALFIPDSSGHRPLHGDSSLYSRDPLWKELVLFYEYFHGDSGKGCGASHQTGWTALIIEFLHKVKDTAA